MKVTAILCTYNRCQTLARALESGAALQTAEGDEFEILVVDNNSRDQTRDVIESFCKRFPGRFRYLFEPRQGKSHALNAGIREAHGEVLAFTDDDVTLDPAWLRNLTAPLRTGECAGAGGRVFPDRDFSPPRWLSLDGPYGRAPLVMYDLGSVAGLLKETPFGANMAFRREVFDKYGGFRVDLGPSPGSEIRSEDSEFANRLLVAGELLRYEPSAVVYHQIPENRLTKEYFLRWWFDKARADIRAHGIPPGDIGWRLGGIPLVYFRRLIIWMLRWMTTIEPAKRFKYKIYVWMLVGRIQESHHLSSTAKRQMENAVPQ